MNTNELQTITNPGTLELILALILALAAGAVFIAGSLMRCKGCGRFHDSDEDETACCKAHGKEIKP